MKKLYTLFSFSLICSLANAQTGPYWATDVAPILYANCTTCHHQGGIAPFSLMTYNDAVLNSSGMVYDITHGVMPPWPPDTNYTRFCNERKLSASQIQTISDWVNNGAQQGNSSQAPTPPTYTNTPVLANADLVLQMPAYTVNTPTDLYRCFVMPSGISQNEYITKMEVIPGNRSCVHHVLVYQDQSSTCINLDNNDPGPGYTWFGDVGSSTATLIGGWVPGQGVWELPPNMGVELMANTNIIMQIHYPGGTFNQTDSTQVRFTFSTGVVRTVTLNPVINHFTSLTNGPLHIPADSVKTFYAQENVLMNSTLISIAPHMHLIGHSMINYAVDPSGDTIPLIDINNWSFHWQGFYTFRQPVHVPYGSVLYARAVYDNTSNNPENPNTPPADVWAGESTTDEMYIIYYAYLPYQPGDENIIVDSTIIQGVQQQSFSDYVKTPQLYDAYPVPAAGNSVLNISYFLPEESKVTVDLTDMSGKVVSVPVKDENTSAGFTSKQVSTDGLAAGTYLLRLTTDGIVKTKTIVIE
ncbi:MAG TPA: T9SS type A sorting domain-containing protein [Bacteroidia bacterium]|nr:T9SS type A sorting domain-containing protein [Bacteroidia bacterium]